MSRRNEKYYMSSEGTQVFKAKDAEAAAKKAWRANKKRGTFTVEQLGGDDGGTTYHVKSKSDPFATKKPHQMKGEHRDRGNKRFQGV
jgi:hypothetical protein